MDKGKYFVLFSNCKEVLGAKEMAIYDLQYGELYKFPVAFSSILNKIANIPKSEYIDHFDEETCKVLASYLEFLIEHDLGHYTDHPNWFPSISDEWDFPAIVTNAIIEIENVSILLSESIQQLEALNCKSIEIRVFGNVNYESVVEICNQTLETGIQSMNIYLSSYDDAVIKEQWMKLMKANPRLFNVFLFNQPLNNVLDIEGNYKVFCITNPLSNNACGKIDRNYFSINIPTFTESIHYNSCLNRKISIDSSGNIKNCPSMKESFGNIKNTTLREALEKPGFKKYWNINKNKIHVCKDCEFRYACTDCRAYLDNPEDILSKPLKCGYNPYTAEWTNWSSNPLKQKTIEFYEL